MLSVQSFVHEDSGGKWLPTHSDVQLVVLPLVPVSVLIFYANSFEKGSPNPRHMESNPGPNSHSALNTGISDLLT